MSQLSGRGGGGSTWLKQNPKSRWWCSQWQWWRLPDVSPLHWLPSTPVAWCVQSSSSSMWFGDTYMRMNKRDNYLIKIMAKLIWSDRSALLSDPTASGKSFLLAPSVSGVRSMGPLSIWGTHSLSDLWLKLCWCDSGWWWYQFNSSKLIWSGDTQWGLGGHQGGRQGGAGDAWSVEAGVCDHGGDNICVLLNHIGEMIGVIEMVEGSIRFAPILLYLIHIHCRRSPILG